MSDNNENALEFSWDPAKAATNLRRHRVSFEMAAQVFLDPDRTEDDDPFAEGEYRTITTGRVGRVLLTVIYAMPEEGLCRPISARHATPEERKSYG